MAGLPDRAVSLLAAHPRWAALILGLVAALGFPPLRIWGLTLLAMAGFVVLVDRAPSLRNALWRGWLFGWAHFTFANNWIANAFTYQEAMPAWLGWFAVPLLAIYLAVYPMLAAGGAWAIARGRGHAITGLALAGSWIVAEWLRSWVFTGYSWDPLSLVLLGPFETPGLAAVLPWFGTYAASGLVVLLATGFLLLLTARRWLFAGGLAALLSIGMYLPGPPEREGTLAVTIVQPDFGQGELVDPRLWEPQYQTLARLSDTPFRDRQRLLVWPEGVIPDYLRDGYPQRFYDRTTAGGDPALARTRLGYAAGEQTLLLTGVQDLALENGNAVGAYNVVTALAPDGRIVDGYAKAHLVPYGEYLALRWLLEPLGATRLVAGTLDFFPGPGPRTLELGPWGKAGLQICYEIIFSGQVVDPENRPDYIVNPSVDGWFGWFGPPQHFAQARMRAIEEGLPVLRSTTTGISGIVDANGVVRHAIGMREEASVDALVPLAKPPTLFARTGNWLAIGWALVFLLAAAVALRRHRA